jgi:hypothetical protein
MGFTPPPVPEAPAKRPKQKPARSAQAAHDAKVEKANRECGAAFTRGRRR